MQRLTLALALLLSCGMISAGEVLYNGIQLPDEWPPRPKDFPRKEPRKPPYLVTPPKVIPIDVGRQLFVDDFLIERTTLKRTIHQPKYHAKSPVLKAEKPWEFQYARNIPFAAPFSGGVWWDPKDRTFLQILVSTTERRLSRASENVPKRSRTNYGDSLTATHR